MYLIERATAVDWNVRRRLTFSLFTEERGGPGSRTRVKKSDKEVEGDKMKIQMDRLRLDNTSENEQVEYS